MPTLRPSASTTADADADDPRIFCGCFPTGLVWADRHVEEHGDYKRLGYLNYSTLVLSVEPDCPADLAEEIRRDAATVQAKRGQHFRVAGNMTVVLGDAAPNPPMPATLRLAHGPNPDIRGGYWDGTPSVPRSQRVSITSFADASETCRKWIDQHGLGGGNWYGGEIYDGTGKQIANVSYNGRVWQGVLTATTTEQQEIGVSVEPRGERFAVRVLEANTWKPLDGDFATAAEAQAAGDAAYRPR